MSNNPSTTNLLNENELAHLIGLSLASVRRWSPTFSKLSRIGNQRLGRQRTRRWIPLVGSLGLTRLPLLPSRPSVHRQYEPMEQIAVGVKTPRACGRSTSSRRWNKQRGLARSPPGILNWKHARRETTAQQRETHRLLEPIPVPHTISRCPHTVYGQHRLPASG